MNIQAFGSSLVILLLGAWLNGCSTRELAISEAWIPEAPPNAAALAGYMTLENRTGGTRTLTGANSALFERIEIHQTVYEKDSGLARMVREEQVIIKPGHSFHFKPGGHHLMLFKPGKALREGDTVLITLVFADGSSPTVEFEVRRDRLRL